MTTNAGTPRTRRQLRKALQATESRASRAEAESTNKAMLLRRDGWSEEVRYGLFGTHPVWTPPKRLTQADIDAAKAQARREALEKVIDALELVEYGYHKPGAYYFGGYTGVNQRPGHERLWDDINTALEARAEKKQAAEREATEKKVAGLTTRKLEVNVTGVADTLKHFQDLASHGEGDIKVTPRKNGKSTATKKAKETKK